MKFLFIESYYLGSHAHFVNGLSSCSSHDIDVVTMPGENWRWRMLAAALHMVDAIPPLDGYDGIIVTDLFNLADFKALVGQPCPPVLAYFHENQITYPQPPGDKGAFQLGIINITTALAADRQVDAEKQKDPLLIIWNHRWGFDKNCEIFFEAIRALADRGVDFRLALMGENFGKIPDAFRRAKKRFNDKILQYGYVSERRAYEEWLKRGAVVISTAIQENFGISVVEAVLMGCIPLLPSRLSYPEILPTAYHEHFLYQNKYDLMEKLFDIMTHYSRYEPLRDHLVEEMKSFLWPNVAAGYDRMLARLSG